MLLDNKYNEQYTVTWNLVSNFGFVDNKYNVQ